jgi:hypothetical protein
VYKVLSQTVPPAAKTEELIEAEHYFEDILRGVDSSLLDEWEKLRNPDYVPEDAEPIAEHKAFTRNRPAFIRSSRNAIFDLVKALSSDNLAAVLGMIEPDDSSGKPWNHQRLDDALGVYFQTHQHIRLDPEARSAKHTHLLEESPRRWIIEQTLIDPDEMNDWSVRVIVDLDGCDSAGKTVLMLDSIAPIA